MNLSCLFVFYCCRTLCKDFIVKDKFVKNRLGFEVNKMDFTLAKHSRTLQQNIFIIAEDAQSLSEKSRRFGIFIQDRDFKIIPHLMVLLIREDGKVVDNNS